MNQRASGSPTFTGFSYSCLFLLIKIVVYSVLVRRIKTIAIIPVYASNSHGIRSAKYIPAPLITYSCIKNGLRAFLWSRIGEKKIVVKRMDSHVGEERVGEKKWANRSMKGSWRKTVHRQDVQLSCRKELRQSLATKSTLSSCSGNEYTNGSSIFSDCTGNGGRTVELRYF